MRVQFPNEVDENCIHDFVQCPLCRGPFSMCKYCSEIFLSHWDAYFHEGRHHLQCFPCPTRECYCIYETVLELDVHQANDGH
ncbi:unnamed protein product [Allacma fusca]|uniref:C2H2-type domain-containing protein n=1 Tax=Allacma fusca TaxID=39272 RepID=A0A8J2JMP3_9HEXA|nr:unnamed protein product [Allacma fusca]